MTKREKTLALLIGVMLIGLIGVSAVRRISGAFDDRRDTIDRLDLEIAGKNMVLTRGTRAAGKLTAYERSSLPSDPALARGLYQGWLLELAEERVAMHKVSVGNLPSRPVGDVYYQHAFSVNCQGDLRQLTDFLYKFHSAGFLHRISRMHVRPLSDSKQLTLTFAIEALSMTKAPEVNELAPPVSNRLAEDERETYMNSILYRNLFSPGNKAPRLALIETQRGNPGRSVQFRASASDPENDRVLYEFEGDVPAGARIDSRSGDVTLTYEENGEYHISIRATDVATPPRSDVARVTIRIEDPPPPREPTPAPPGFDAATQAVVTGLTDAFGQRKLFITVRTEGIILKLREGDKIEVGTINGKIKRIGADEVEIETSDGKSIIVELGDSLVNA
jgi:hypothetical protein